MEKSFGYGAYRETIVTRRTIAHIATNDNVSKGIYIEQRETHDTVVNAKRT